ncbi:MAG TPA: hypothetical protein VFK05_26165 [Polyangiaceae bacterium]|nr:hypothetical protein [Polyangiaceae bacterium]
MRSVSNTKLWLYLLSGTLAACSGKSVAEVPAGQQSDTSAIFGGGARLKAHYLDGGSGARALVDFYDTELKSNCQFVESASGQYHCLPTERAFSYFDADCSEPAYVDHRACGQGPALAGLLVSALSEECDALAEGYSLAEERPVTRLYARGLDGCIPVSNSKTAWSLVREPLTRFVQGSLSVVGAPGGLQASRVTGDDGAFSNLRLMAEGKPCEQVVVQGVARCMPGLGARPSSGYFDTASCAGSELALRIASDGERCAKQRAEYVLEERAPTCVEDDALYQAIDDVRDAYRVEQGNQCLARLRDSKPDNYSFYHAGEELTAEDAPPMAITRVGSGVLGVPCQTDREGTPLLAPSQLSGVPGYFPLVWSLAEGSACGAIVDPSGTRRCVPASVVWSTVTQGSSGPFSDASCTQRVVQWSLGQCSNGSRPFSYFIETDLTSCGSVITHAYAVELYSGPLYEQRDTCTALSPSPDHFYLVRGPEVALASFPPIADTTER